VRELMHKCTMQKGWIAACMNMRGCGGTKLMNPRGYNGAFTGDIRTCVSIVGCEPRDQVFGRRRIVGSVAGGIVHGNPLAMDSRNCVAPFGTLLSLGVQKYILSHLEEFSRMSCPHYRRACFKALVATHIEGIDRALAPQHVSNDPYYPYTARVGYKNAEEYWNDASSYRRVQHVSVPLMSLVAEDDAIVYEPSQSKLSYMLSNPNVIVVKTRCGGHLGWQESQGGGIFGFGTSWADKATVDFIQAILDNNNNKQEQKEKQQHDDVDPREEKISRTIKGIVARDQAAKLKSKL